MGNDATVIVDKSIIDTWDISDFNEKTTACDFLAQFKDDAVLFSRYKSLVAEKARKLKVQGWASILRDYMKMLAIQQSNKPVWIDGNTTDFIDQPMELSCGKYSCTDSGITIRNEYGDNDIKVCKDPIMPVRILVDIDTGEQMVELAYRNWMGWKKSIFSSVMLSKSKDIVELSSIGIPITSESARDMVKYISYMITENANVIPHEKTVSKLGWTSEGFSPYVQGLQYSGSNQYQDIYSGVTEHGNYQKWLGMVKELRSSNVVPARIVLAAAFASPLVSLVGGLPFFVHLWSAQAGIGKTVLQKVSASVWGNPEKLLRTFNATDVAMEHLASFCNHLPLYLDELQTIQGKKGFDDIIYKLCEGQGKARGAKTGGTQRILTWCNVMVSTGEQPITSSNSKAGAVNRVLEIEIHDKAFVSNIDAVSVAKQNYGFAGKMFVEAIENDPFLVDEIKAKQRELYDELVLKATDKQSVSGSILLAADWFADKLIFHDGLHLTAEELIPYLTTEAQANTNAKAYEFLCGWVVMNARKFDNPDTGEVYGDIDEKNNCAYIIANKFREALSDNGYSPASFLSMAKKAGYIKAGKNRTDVCRRIHGFKTPVHCFCLILPSESDEDQLENENSGYEEVEELRLPF